MAARDNAGWALTARVYLHEKDIPKQRPRQFSVVWTPANSLSVDIEAVFHAAAECGDRFGCPFQHYL